MMKSIRILFFPDWDKQQVKDYIMSLGLTLAALLLTIIIMNIFY